MSKLLNALKLAESKRQQSTLNAPSKTETSISQAIQIDANQPFLLDKIEAEIGELKSEQVQQQKKSRELTLAQHDLEELRQREIKKHTEEIQLSNAIQLRLNAERAAHRAEQELAEQTQASIAVARERESLEKELQRIALEKIQFEELNKQAISEKLLVEQSAQQAIEARLQTEQDLLKQAQINRDAQNLLIQTENERHLQERQAEQLAQERLAAEKLAEIEFRELLSKRQNAIAAIEARKETEAAEALAIEARIHAEQLAIQAAQAEIQQTQELNQVIEANNQQRQHAMSLELERQQLQQQKIAELQQLTKAEEIAEQQARNALEQERQSMLQQTEMQRQTHLHQVALEEKIAAERELALQHESTLATEIMLRTELQKKLENEQTAVDLANQNAQQAETLLVEIEHKKRLESDLANAIAARIDALEQARTLTEKKLSEEHILLNQIAKNQAQIEVERRQIEEQMIQNTLLMDAEKQRAIQQSELAAQTQQLRQDQSRHLQQLTELELIRQANLDESEREKQADQEHLTRLQKIVELENQQSKVSAQILARAKQKEHQAQLRLQQEQELEKLQSERVAQLNAIEQAEIEARAIEIESRRIAQQNAKRARQLKITQAIHALRSKLGLRQLGSDEFWIHIVNGTKYLAFVVMGIAIGLIIRTQTLSMGEGLEYRVENEVKAKQAALLKPEHTNDTSPIKETPASSFSANQLKLDKNFEQFALRKRRPSP
ncbi:hypothetical protein [Undibacterium fentianense]|uniref:Uncharacterized protein n=1 Tax=Undibacterium fentianense TaxID=2828728 RepID=A0A941E4L4_9BURK|nr:hypothetical protein [Undibacterium fentianense]MBR7800846.1 hypothetical protein [Undibacterium fentianense]